MKLDSWPYDNPENLDYNNVDEPVRELCRVINASDWLRTMESCAGHPRSIDGWSDSTYLRLLVSDIKRFFMLVDSFDEALGGMADYLGRLKVQYNSTHPVGYSFHVYFPKAKDPAERDIWIDLFKRKFSYLQDGSQ